MQFIKKNAKNITNFNVSSTSTILLIMDTHAWEKKINNFLQN